MAARSLVVIDLSKRQSLGLTSIGWRGNLPVARHPLFLSHSSGSYRRGHCELLLHTIFKPPFAKTPLVQVKPMLLRSYDHSRPHKPHECYYLIGSETMPID